MPALVLAIASFAATSVISEIQAAPASGTPEWIEISVPGGTDLSGWTVDDGIDRKPIPAGSSAAAGGIAVLSPDCAALRSAWMGANIPCVAPAGWNRLSTDSDVVVLRDRSGARVDSVAWNAKSWGAWPSGRSRERVSPGGGSCDPANWAPSTAPGGTPGWIPSRISPGIGGLRMEPKGKVAVPGAANRIALSAPTGSKVLVELFDLSRRRVAVLWNDEPPPEGEVGWSARANGRNLAPGVYALRASGSTGSVNAWVVVGAP